MGRRVGEDICMKRRSVGLVGEISGVGHWLDNRVRGKVTVRDAIRIGKISGAVIPAITSAACGSSGKNLVPWGVHACEDTNREKNVVP